MTLVITCSAQLYFTEAAESAFTLTNEEKKYLSSIRDKPIYLAYSYDLLYSTRSGDSPSGMLLPFVDLLQKELGLTVKMRKHHWGEAFKQIEGGSVDFYGPIGLDETRLRQYVTINPISRADAQIVTRISAPLGSLMNLKTKKIGLLTGSIIHKAISTYLYPHGQVVYYPSILSMIGGLEEGKIDCFATVDNAEVEILRNPELHYEFTVRNFYTDQGFISDHKEMKPLAGIINRYLASKEGEALVASVANARRNELLRTQRRRLAKEIAHIRERYDVVRIYDSGVLYPVSFREEGKHKGLQAEINELFKVLTGIEVHVLEFDYFKNGLFKARELIQAGKCQAISGTYPHVETWEHPNFEYSLPIWTDRIQTYTYGPAKADLRSLRVGTTLNALNYINWDVVCDREPSIYNSRESLMVALKKGEIDAVFVSEMTFNYYYTILKDYRLRELGNTTAVADMRMIYGAQNAAFNRVFNETIKLYQVIYPHGMTKWQQHADRYKSDTIRARDTQHFVFYHIFALFVAMTFVICFLLRRYARYDWQIRKLIRQQQTFDLAWGDLKTRRFSSKGNHPFFRKWGLPFKKANCSMEELTLAFGWDLYEDYLASMKSMERGGVDFIIAEKAVVPPGGGATYYYRRYLHRLDKYRFMSCLQDITDEKAQVEELTHVASRDFLSTLLTRRAMNDLILRKSKELDESGARAFLVLFDIDNFKNVNDNYGHDVGDDVLKAVANVIQNAEDSGQATSRWGGEEFLALLDCETLEQAAETAWRIVRTVADLPMAIKGTGKELHVTLSAGLAELDCQASYEHSVQHADKALYEAKRSGKNRVCIWQPPLP